jgi:hypothetical protein
MTTVQFHFNDTSHPNSLAQQTEFLRRKLSKYSRRHWFGKVVFAASKTQNVAHDEVPILYDILSNKYKHAFISGKLVRFKKILPLTNGNYFVYQYYGPTFEVNGVTGDVIKTWNPVSMSYAFVESTLEMNNGDIITSQHNSIRRFQYNSDKAVMHPDVTGRYLFKLQDGRIFTTNDDEISIFSSELEYQRTRVLDYYFRGAIELRPGYLLCHSTDGYMYYMDFDNNIDTEIEIEGWNYKNDIIRFLKLENGFIVVHCAACVVILNGEEIVRTVEIPNYIDYANPGHHYAVCEVEPNVVGYQSFNGVHLLNVITGQIRVYKQPTSRDVMCFVFE